MRLRSTSAAVLLAAVIMLMSRGVSAGEHAKADRPAERSLIQRVSHAVMPSHWLPGPLASGKEPRPLPEYSGISGWFGLWRSPELFASDLRCQPLPFAPRGYGWPKNTSCTRLDYTPYAVRAPFSVHGPAVWPRFFRRPCGECESCRKHLDCGCVNYAPPQ